MKVKLEKYNPKWKTCFENEKSKLQNMINSKGTIIEHIGSTSIEGISSKPVIDIMIGVEDDEELDSNIDKILKLGYTYVQKYETIMPFRRYFFRLKSREVQIPRIIGFNDPDLYNGNHEDIFHVHMVKINSNFWKDQLLFRDYLRSNVKAKREYETVKKSLAKLEWNSINEYAEAKSECISKLLEEGKKYENLRFTNTP